MLSAIQQVNNQQDIFWRLGDGHKMEWISKKTFAHLPRVHQAFYRALVHADVDFTEAIAYLKEGDNVNVEGLHGRTLLHESVWHMSSAYRLFYTLLEHPQMNINVRDLHLHTPLFLAVSTSFYSGSCSYYPIVIRQLILRGANPELAEIHGLTAHHYARQLDALSEASIRVRPFMKRARVIKKALQAQQERYDVLKVLDQELRVRLARSYFHGETMKEVVRIRLSHCAMGTYILFIDCDGPIGKLNLMIARRGGHGVEFKSIEWATGCFFYEDRAFSYLEELISAYGSIYLKPYRWYTTPC